MSEEKAKATWWKIWIVSCFAFLPTVLIPFFLFETEIERAITLVNPNYRTIFGFWFFALYCIWAVFSVCCIYQIVKPKTQKEREEYNICAIVVIWIFALFFVGLAGLISLGKVALLCGMTLATVVAGVIIKSRGQKDDQ